MNINGFKIPAMLETNLRSDGYKLSLDQTARLKMLIHGIEAPAPFFWGHDDIVEVNELWTSDAAEDYLGHPSLRYPPGNVDPKLTLIIGETDPDSPIALDYRTAQPRVIYFCDIDRVTYWVELSPTYEALMKTIGAA